MERNPNKSKIIQENLDTQNAAFHLLELPFKSWKTVLDKVAALSIENITAAIKTKLLVSKVSPFLRAIHDGENCPLCGSEHPNVMQAEDVSEH
jgi:exonuclease SbcC